MPTSQPPRFVPTLTEPAANHEITTTVADDSKYVRQNEASDSMIDLDLDLIDEHPAKLAHVPPHSIYQDSGSYQALVQRESEHPHRPPASSASHATPSAPQTGASQAQSRAQPVARPEGYPMPMHEAAQPSHGASWPPNWESQLQEAIRRGVRQELQQQMPFLLLQWSRQLEDKMSPMLHEQMLELIRSWDRQG